MMETGTAVSGLKPAQLLPFLAKLGISRGGLDSVWEKEVTGGMLCEFCEEDIKDVFTEFKDRFLIRKLLRDLNDKPQSRHKPATLSTSSLSDSQGLSPTSSTAKVEGHSRSPSYSSHSSKLTGLEECYSDLAQAALTRKNSESRKQSMETNVIEIGDDDEEEIVEKKPRLDELLSVPKAPSFQDRAFGTLRSLRQKSSSSDGSPSTLQHSAADSYGLKSLSPFAVFMNRPDFISNFNPVHSHGPSAALSEHQVTAGTHLQQTEQALCLKKTVSSSQVRTETSSPATQPSSTTPDSFMYQESKHLDLASTAAMTQLALKYNAVDILSKKAQRSRPSSPQKLGSILIRNAALQANLWETAPCLRSISQTQRQCFLNYVYSIAPQIQEYEQLLWQRLSETLQNRRKYLLDKKLGKRGVHTSNSAEHSSASDTFCNFNWNVTTQIVRNTEDTGLSNEDNSTQESDSGAGTVKSEPE